MNNSCPVCVRFWFVCSESKEFFGVKRDGDTRKVLPTYLFEPGTLRQAKTKKESPHSAPDDTSRSAMVF